MMAVSRHKSVYMGENSIENIIELKKSSFPPPLAPHSLPVPVWVELSYIQRENEMKWNELLSQIIIELVPEEIKLFACSESSVNWNV